MLSAELDILKESSNFSQNDSSSTLLWPTDVLAEGSGFLTEVGTAKAPSDAQQHALFFPTGLPPAGSVTFNDSSFFRRNGSNSLPSPTDVLAEACRMGVTNDFLPPPVQYPSLGLTVKYGRTVSIAEGQCLWALRHLPGNAVPVPEVYGWTVEAGFCYIYMEYIPGVTLSDRWASLSESEK